MAGYWPSSFLLAIVERLFCQLGHVVALVEWWPAVKV